MTQPTKKAPSVYNVYAGQEKKFMVEGFTLRQAIVKAKTLHPPMTHIHGPKQEIKKS